MGVTGGEGMKKSSEWESMTQREGDWQEAEGSNPGMHVSHALVLVCVCMCVQVSMGQVGMWGLQASI